MQHLKPVYHLRPGVNWINDPNAPVYWRGEYHLFFQYNPNEARWGSIHWGHAVSEDLLRWRFLSPALSPGPEEYDREGIFSGGGVVHDDHLYLYYTGAEPQSQCLAVSDAAGGFKKHPLNPLIPAPPPAYPTGDFRDPFVWKSGDEYRMIVAAGYGGRGIIFRYVSQDLISWRYEGEFFAEELRPGVPAFECPLYFTLAGREVLVISPYASPFYLIGRTEDTRFIPEVRGIFDANPGWYAPNTLQTPDGRRIIFAWLQEERSEADQLADGWSGAFALPREIRLEADGGIRQAPLRELTELRTASRRLSLESADGRFILGDLPWSAELEFTLPRPASGSWELRLRENAIGDSYYSVEIDRDEIVLTDMLNAPGGATLEKRAPLPQNGEVLEIRLFLDASIIELFINRQTALSSRLYPPHPEQRGAALIPPTQRARKPEVLLHTLDGVRI